MDLLIKVNNISQIRQITKSLPQDILKQAVVDEKPVLSYLWNTPVFSNKDGMFSVENVNREFILSNTGVLQDANDRVLAYLDNSKADFPFEVWYKRLKLASFKSYRGLQIFLSNSRGESLGHIDVYFLTGEIPANIFLWFIQYKDENGVGVQFRQIERDPFRFSRERQHKSLGPERKQVRRKLQQRNPKAPRNIED